jgi:hypothetical protein
MKLLWKMNFPHASTDTKKLNPHLFGPVDVAVKAYAQTQLGKRVRQSSKPLMNKLESEFYLHLLLRFNKDYVKIQAVRFRLGNGIWYVPDFVISAPWATCYEVKGPHAFRGGFENLKVAASTYPEIKWRLVWKENGRWIEQEILP